MKIIISYIKDNKLVSIVFAYMAVSIIINLVFSIDIMIPCLWKTVFNIDCPACGLTRSTAKLVKFDIVGAYKQNPLVFIVLPALTYFISKDFYQYIKKQKYTKEP